ncbi:MAG: DNA repair ATPase [Desulfococcaceae bacterium]|nr:DNA repair ATPase [Desulfococcaceae bacterium]
MSQQSPFPENTNEVKSDETVLEGGTYEIIRSRLLTHGKELRSRLDKLNTSRKEIFGAIEQTLLATERISTQHNCIPRDMVPVNGKQFIFGYNVHLGLKSEIDLSDIFSVYAYEDHSFRKLDRTVLNSGQFETDLKNLYKYYKQTQFAKFTVTGPHLYMIFRVGKAERDIKAFKWLMEEGGLTYLDNRSDHEIKDPPRHEFEWKRCTREMHRTGKHPHISLEDRVFVEAVGGDITFKVEDNTESGQGIYAEPVDNPDQTLDDAEIRYAVLGHLILVKIKPYMENLFRYYIFNGKTESVVRVDEIEHACVLLPDDQGLMFANGYYLQSGELKRFDLGVKNMRFEHRMVAPNGEDFLYIFYNMESGDYVLLSYNLIEQKVENPIPCNGYSHFENGEMIFFRAAEEPVKHHVIRIWQTPFVGPEYAFSEKSDAFLYKVGNPNIVHCMAECNEMLKLMHREELYATLYVDLMKKAAGIADAYFWLDKPEAFHLKETVLQIKEAAAGAIEEFEKVVSLKKNTAAEVARVTARTKEILDDLRPESLDHIDGFVKGLAGLRTVRGEIISLKDLRYVDMETVERLDAEVAENSERISALCVEFLLQPESLIPYENRVKEAGAKIDSLSKVTEAQELETEVGGASDELEMLIEIVSNLHIEDSTQTTRIIDSISDIYSQLNQVRANLKNKKKSLQSTEGVAQFKAQVKLLNQSVVNYLDLCDTPDKCDEYLTKLMVGVEELEGRFADFDEFIVELSEKRDEIYNAFESRKLSLTEARNKRATALMSAAERILKGIRNRVAGMEEISAINGYFASDLMISKIRDIVEQLLALDDTVKADDIQSRLKTIREDTVRQLKDRKELFADGQNIIRFGKHQFTVNVQPLDLTVILRDGKQMFHLTGTNFFEAIENAEFLETRSVWDMEVPSENPQVYRGEYLAFQLLKEVEGKDAEEVRQIQHYSEKEIRDYVQKFMGPRYSEGYSKGIHDHDGAKLFREILLIHTAAGLLRFHPRSRALARLFWQIYFQAEGLAEKKQIIADKLAGFGLMHELFPGEEKQDRYIGELGKFLCDFCENTGLFPADTVAESARYLFEELTRPDRISGEECFVISREAWEIAEGLIRQLKNSRFGDRFKEAREKLAAVPTGEYELVRDWVTAYIATLNRPELTDYTDEAAVLIFSRSGQKRDVTEVSVVREISGLVGDHPLIQEGKYSLNYIRFMEKLRLYEKETLPLFLRYGELKKTLTDRMRQDLRLEEFRPRILSSFVRNKLINQVYLPLIGDNLAKQIGTAGEGKRTDLMGLLLLISPPGYGKTTLMEYIANRLGIIFMKINGPAIGHQVTSLDPAEAPNASAREEVLKLNLALEMGDNVMIYLDDIQHCNPELLQKFISLCDAQRKIEGVYKGKSRTYDLRGKKVVVCMAGNPFTESGEKFRIPDMLSNRADTYNLGDIIGDSEDVFKMSYLENSLTSNAVLNRLSSRSQQDVYGIIRIAESGSREGVEFEGNLSAEEISEMVSVMEKMITVREIILKMNLQYIYSAAQADEYRTEPAFKLQGSYRNMNRIAEKIVPIMNAEELKTLILSQYEQDARTLTTGAEANLLKFKELTGWLSADEAQRWEDIKKTFRKNQMLRGMDDSDPVVQVVGQLSAFYDGLEGIRGVLDASLKQAGKQVGMTKVSFAEETMQQMEKLMQTLQSVLSAASKEESGPLLPPKMEVISRMPDGFLEVITGQMSIMNAWLDPMFKSSRQQSAVMKKLYEEIRNLQSVYREIMNAKQEGGWQDIEKYDVTLKANPKDHKTYYKRGLAWYNKNENTRAYQDFKNALDIQPKNKKYQRIVAHLEAEMTTDRGDADTGADGIPRRIMKEG